MRDYAYVWHEPAERRVILSGIGFRDLAPDLHGVGGLVLLRHQFDDVQFDRTSRFDFIEQDRLPALAADDIHGYGDFCWADFVRGTRLNRFIDDAVADLTFFAHAGRPLRAVEIPGLGNRFLCWAHDDPWYTGIFYREWEAIDGPLRRLLPQLLNAALADRTVNAIRDGDCAFWCADDVALPCEGTQDIDSLQRKHWRSRSGK